MANDEREAIYEKIIYRQGEIIKLSQRQRVLDAKLRKIYFLIGAVLVALGFGFVGKMDMEDEIAAEQLYCEMVEKGHWGAYNKSINCEDK